MVDQLHLHREMEKHFPPDNATFAGDDDVATPEQEISRDTSTEKDAFAPEDETVHIEPRVDGDEWLLAQEAFFERFPSVEVPTEWALVDRLHDGRLTVQEFRKNFGDVEVQYETLAALLRGMPRAAGAALVLPSIDAYLSWSQDEKNRQQANLEYGLAKSQYATWLKQISGRFSVLAESLQAYKHVADVEGIALEDNGNDNAEEFAMAAK